MLKDILANVPTYAPAGSVIPITKAAERAAPVEVLTLSSVLSEPDLLKPLQGKTVVLYGFGSQSANHARCLRQDGIDVLILGRNTGSQKMRQAKREGFTVISIEELSDHRVDVLGFGLPDDQQAKVLIQLASILDREVTTLMFYHGMTVHYGQQGFYGEALQEALNGWNMAIVAPKGPGNTVWENKSIGGGIACLYGAHEDSPNYDEALALAKAYAVALGGLRGALLQTTFKEETETDHFGEQGVLCGAIMRAYYFMIDYYQEHDGMSFKEAQAFVEQEIINFGHAIRRGGAEYVWYQADEAARERMRNIASIFYGCEVTDDMLIHPELETIGFALRKLQPHLSPVDPVGKVVCGDDLPSPLFVLGDNGGIAGILMVASAAQFELGRLAGYTAEGMQFEVQQEIALITDCFLRGGLAYMIMRISKTAKHGMFVVAKYLEDSKQSGLTPMELFCTVLAMIQNGSYAKATKAHLNDIEPGSDDDWLWKAAKAVIESDAEKLSFESRPATRLDYKGEDVKTAFVNLTDKPWEYPLTEKDGAPLAA